MRRMTELEIGDVEEISVGGEVKKVLDYPACGGQVEIADFRFRFTRHQPLF